MTALLLSTDPDSAMIAMDTMTTVGGQPAGFCSKFRYLPHIRTAFACTGIHGLMDAWVALVSAKLFPAGIEDLRERTPGLLRECWQELGYGHAMNKTTSTMYHVGFSEITDEIVTHVFRSERDFALETLNHDTYWRPKDPGIEIDPEWELGPKVHALMVAMQEQQSGIPPGERIHIGGEATLLVLDRTGASIFSAGAL